MPIISITFEHEQASSPKYKFGDRISVKDDCAPKDWLTGEIIGLTLEQEVFQPCWWYSVKLASPPGGRSPRIIVGSKRIYSLQTGKALKL